MKVKKKWKRYVHQIALSCLLICSVVQWVPESAYADYLYDSSHNTNHYKYTFNTTVDNKPYSVTYDLQGTSPIFLVEHKRKSITYYYFVSEEDWTGSKIITEDGKERSFSINAYANRCDKWGAFYQSSGGDVNISGNPPRWVWDADKYDSLIASGKSDACSGENRELHYNAKLLFAKNKYALGDLVCEVGDGISGSVNNPIEDSEIGTIDISGKGYAQDATANSDNIDEQFYTKWNWKNKTSTGFSLTKNKYHMTRIQVMVESRCLVYSDLKHKTVKEKFENYGERNKLKNGILPTDKPYTIYLKDVMSALPKTKGEFHNVLFCGYNFKYYWRVMCNDSPTGTGKWYCGGWRAVDLNQDSNKSKDINDTNNGHFDDDGNWVKDEDDGHNNTTDFSDDISGQNPDDANDTITNPKKDKADKFGWDDFKNLINECKQVPDLIKSVFSFLPDWVLVFVALAFGIWLFVLIKHAVI